MYMYIYKNTAIDTKPSNIGKQNVELDVLRKTKSQRRNQTLTS